MIEGRIETRSWQDAAGVKKYRTEIIAEKMQLGPKSASASSSNPVSKDQTTPPVQEEIPIIEEDQDGEIDVRNIPF